MSASAAYQLRAEAFAALLTRLHPYLHPHGRELAETLVHVGELRLAGEMICDWLSEDGLALPSALHAELLRVLAEVRVEERYVRSVPEPAP